MVISEKAKQDLLALIKEKETPLIKPWPHISVCGPSGSGKSTIIRTDLNSIIKVKPKIYGFSISGVTRDRRVSEIDGEDYHFMTIADFGMRDFFETNEYTGNKKLYGTLVSEIERIAIYNQQRIVFDIDPNGAMALQESFKDDIFTVFLNTSGPELERRLIKRLETTGESMEDVRKRLIAAERERRMVREGTFKPDLEISYDDMPAGQAVNLILMKAMEKVMDRQAA